MSTGQSRHFATKVTGWLVDAFAKRETGIARDLDRATDLAFGLFDGLSDRLLVVEDKALLKQTNLLVDRKPMIVEGLPKTELSVAMQ